MIGVLFTPRAERDIRQIWLDIAQNNPHAADKLLRQFETRAQDLALFPQTGVARPDLGAGFRIAIIHPYLMLYRISRDTLTIVRVLHGARHLPDAVKKDI